MTGPSTITRRIGSVQWKTSPEFLPVIEALFPPDRDPGDLPPGARLLKENRIRAVFTVHPPGFDGSIVVKRYRPANLVDRIRDAAFFPVAEREFRSARLLRALAVPVPEPLASGVSRRWGLPSGSFFVSREVGGAVTVLDALRADGEDRALWRALGRFVAGLHRAGVFHPDLHLGNILAVRKGEQLDLWLVDLHSLPLIGGLTPEKAETNLAQVRNSFVAGSPKAFLRGLKAYVCEGVPSGVDAAGLARRVKGKADRMLEEHYARRTLRALKRSTAFALGRSGRFRFVRRRTLPEEDLLRILEQPDGKGPGTVIKEDRRTRLVGGFEAGGEPVILKEYRQEGAGDAWLSFLGRSRGREAWLGGNGLLARGVGAAAPLAFAEERVLWMPRSSFVLLEDLRSLEQLDRLAARSLEKGPGLDVSKGAAALGSFLGSMHCRGVWHADLKACNVMVDVSPPAGPSFRLLDHDRIVFGMPVPPPRRLKNLVQLNTTLPRAVPLRWRARFLRAYLRSAPHPGGFKALWRAVKEESGGRRIVYVSDGGDVFEDPFP